MGVMDLSESEYKELISQFLAPWKLQKYTYRVTLTLLHLPQGICHDHN